MAGGTEPGRYSSGDGRTAANSAEDLQGDTGTSVGRPSLASLRTAFSAGRRGPAKTPQAVCAATARLLEDLPLHELKIGMIVSEAGISRPTFYSYFGGKEDVLAALYASVATDLGEAMRSLYDRPHDCSPGEAITEGLTAMAGVWSARRAVLVAATENRHVIPEIQQFWSEMFTFIVQAVVRQLDRDRAAGIAPSDAPSGPIVSALVFATEQTFYGSSYGKNPGLRDESAAADMLTTMWLATLYAAPGR